MALNWDQLFGAIKKPAQSAAAGVRQFGNVFDPSAGLGGGGNGTKPPAPTTPKKQPWLQQKGMGGLSKGDLLLAGMGILSGRNLSDGLATGGQYLAYGMDRQREEDAAAAESQAKKDEEAARKEALQKAVELMDTGDTAGARAALAGLYPDAAGKTLTEQAFAAPEAKDPLEVNSQLVDPETYEVIADLRDPPKPGDNWVDIETPAGQQGYFQRNERTGQVKRVSAPAGNGVTVEADGTVRVGGPAMPGYGSSTKGKDPAIVMDRDGNAVVSPGQQQAAFNKAQNAQRDWEANNKIVMDDIDRALALVEQGGATGPMAATKDIPIFGGVTPAGGLENLLNTIKANIGFDKLDEMRANSPTGGALGNVTEKEIAFLQAVKGSLEQSQTAENIAYNLQRIKDFYAQHKKDRQEALLKDYPSLADTAQFRATADQEIDDLLAKYGGSE